MPDYVYADFDQQSLDREYSPSSRIEDINVYLDEYATRSAAAREQAGHRLTSNLAYGTAAAQTLDLFIPAAGKPSPLHVYIHGGYWQALGKDDSSFAAPMFLGKSISFAAVNYTLAPNCSLRDIVEENRLAIAFLYRNAERWGIDPSRITLSGSSAGAHLCLMMLATDWTTFGMPVDAISGVCAASGVYDLEPVRLTYVNDAIGMDEEEARDLSPLLLPLKNRCPVSLTVGDNETGEFKRQTQELLYRLTASGVDCRFHETPDRNHFDVILDLADERSWLAQQALAQIRATASGL